MDMKVGQQPLIPVEPLIPANKCLAKMVLVGPKKEISINQFWNLINQLNWSDLSDDTNNPDKCWKKILEFVTLDGFSVHFGHFHTELSNALREHIKPENLDAIAAHVLLHGRRYSENCLEDPLTFAYLEGTDDFDRQATQFIPEKKAGGQLL